MLDKEEIPLESHRSWWRWLVERIAWVCRCWAAIVWEASQLIYKTIFTSIVHAPAIHNKSLYLGLHFGSRKSCKLSIVFENLSRNSVFFRTEVKPIHPPVRWSGISEKQVMANFLVLVLVAATCSVSPPHGSWRQLSDLHASRNEVAQNVASDSDTCRVGVVEGVCEAAVSLGGEDKPHKIWICCVFFFFFFSQIEI